MRRLPKAASAAGCCVTTGGSAVVGAIDIGTFKQAAFNEGVLIDDEDEFKAGRGDRTYHRVRIAFSEGVNRAAIADGMATLRRLLDDGPAAYVGVS